MRGEKAYGIPAHSVDTTEHLRQFAGFIFWSAWAASANRPGDTVTCTHNWSHEPLVGGRPTGESVLWTGVSITMLLAGVCAMVWWCAAQKNAEPAYTDDRRPVSTKYWRENSGTCQNVDIRCHQRRPTRL